MKKSFTKVISTLFPNRVVSFAYHQLTNPQTRKLRPHELETLDKSEKETLKFEQFDIQLYTWKGGEKRVLLVHGWEGQAGNFSDLVEELIAQNYTVYAFDGPSHGFSSRGSTSLFEFTTLVGVLIRKFEVKALVSHSFGGVATTYALSVNQDIKIDKYVLFTTPDKFTERIDDVAKQIGITAKVKKKLIKRLEEEVQQDVSILNVSEFVKSVNVQNALIIHDKNDTVLPIEQSQRVHENWKECELYVVENTGHFRILRTKAVLEKAVDFLND